MARRRYSERRKAELVGKFERSGSSAAAFCRQHRLAYQTFLGWRRELAATTEASAAAECVELEVTRH